MSQTSYSRNMARAYAGSIYDLAPKYVIAAKAAVRIPFGVAVQYKAGAEDEVELLEDGASVIHGVSVFTHSEVNDGEEGYAPESVANILKTGTMNVLVEDAVVQGAPVFVRHTVPGVEQKGAFRSDADGGNAVQVPNAEFLTSAASGEIAQVVFK